MSVVTAWVFEPWSSLCLVQHANHYTTLEATIKRKAPSVWWLCNRSSVKQQFKNNKNNSVIRGFKNASKKDWQARDWPNLNYWSAVKTMQFRKKILLSFHWHTCTPLTEPKGRRGKFSVDLCFSSTFFLCSSGRHPILLECNKKTCPGLTVALTSSPPQEL